MHTIAIICAMQVELEAIKSLVESIEKVNIGPRLFFKGQYKGKEIILTQCGIGKVNASITTTLLIDHFKPDFIINCGVAGGYNENLLPLDVVVADEVFYYDVDCTFCEPDIRYGQVQDDPASYSCSKVLIDLLKSTTINLNYHIGNIMTSDKFATDRSLLTNVIKKYFYDKNVYAVDMESAAIAQTANRFGVDLVIVRSISDVVGIEQEHTYTNFLEQACYNASCIISFLLDNI